MNIDGAVHIADLFGRQHLVKDDKPLSERATLVAYFSKTVRKDPKVIAIRLSHYSLDDLYALRSMCEDRVKRNDLETARKFFWFTSRTSKV